MESVRTSESMTRRVGGQSSALVRAASHSFPAIHNYQKSIVPKILLELIVTFGTNAAAEVVAPDVA